MPPLGIRTNNPGNIELGQPWLGLAPRQAGDRFCRFVAPVWGLRAMACLLITYHRRYGLSTIQGIITRWAPGTENNTDAYIASVAKATGIPAGRAIAVDAEPTLAKLLPAIVRHENGRNPYTPELIEQAIRLALAPPSSMRVMAMVDGGQGVLP